MTRCDELLKACRERGMELNGYFYTKPERSITHSALETLKLCAAAEEACRIYPHAKYAAWERALGADLMLRERCGS